MRFIILFIVCRNTCCNTLLGFVILRCVKFSIATHGNENVRLEWNMFTICALVFSHGAYFRKVYHTGCSINAHFIGMRH